MTDESIRRPVRVGIVGDFDPRYPSQVATNAALDHAAGALGLALHQFWVPTQSLAAEGSEALLGQFDALWCAPGSPYKSMAGALRAIRFARERGRPFVGT